MKSVHTSQGIPSRLSFPLMNCEIVFLRIEGMAKYPDMKKRGGIRKLHEKWKIKSDVFLKKTEEITSFQIACLEIWAKKFWFAKWKKGEKSLREYVKLLILER